MTPKSTRAATGSAKKKKGKDRTGPAKHTHELIIASRLPQIAKVEPFLKKVNGELHLDEVQFHKLMIATTEAVNNGMIHGNRRDPKKKVSVICEVNPRGITVRVKDQGAGFEVEDVPMPLQEERMLEENGRGIFLMRVLMDKVEFSRSPEGSEVVMKLNKQK